MEVYNRYDKSTKKICPKMSYSRELIGEVMCVENKCALWLESWKMKFDGDEWVEDVNISKCGLVL